MSTDFNQEVVWDGNRDLFDKYFSETIQKHKHYIVYFKSNETSFEKAVQDYKKQYKENS